MFTRDKSSTHEFTIPEKVHEENNEETENEDVKNDLVPRNKKSLLLRGNVSGLNPKDDNVISEGTSLNANEANKELHDAVHHQHRDSMEDTK